jgi:hypothetical protein
MAVTLGTHFGRYEIVSLRRIQRKTRRQTVFETRNVRKYISD